MTENTPRTPCEGNFTHGLAIIVGMARTTIFDRLLQTMRTAQLPLPAQEAIEVGRTDPKIRRRELLKLGGIGATALAASGLSACGPEPASARRREDTSALR